MMNFANMVTITLDRHDKRLRSYEHSNPYLFHNLHIQSTMYHLLHSVMFNVFDLQSIKTLRFTDLILMFKSVVRGFAFLTNQPLPDIHLLEKYAHTIFSRADLNNDQNL